MYADLQTNRYALAHARSSVRNISTHAVSPTPDLSMLQYSENKYRFCTKVVSYCDFSINITNFAFILSLLVSCVHSVIPFNKLLDSLCDRQLYSRELPSQHGLGLIRSHKSNVIRHI